MDFLVIFDKRTFKFSKPLAIIPAKPQEFKKKPIFQDLRNSVEFIFYWLKNNNKNTNEKLVQITYKIIVSLAKR